MWTVVIVSFIVIMMLVGITELMRKIWLYLMRPKGDTPRVMLIFLKDDIFAEQIQSAMEYIAWEGRRAFCSVAAIDCGLSEENKLAAKNLADRYANVIFGDADLKQCIQSFR